MFLGSKKNYLQNSQLSGSSNLSDMWANFCHRNGHDEEEMSRNILEVFSNASWLTPRQHLARSKYLSTTEHSKHKCIVHTFLLISNDQFKTIRLERWLTGACQTNMKTSVLMAGTHVKSWMWHGTPALWGQRWVDPGSLLASSLAKTHKLPVESETLSQCSKEQ